MPTTIRPTKQERSRLTRRSLLDAAVECLIESGYASTSTIAVARRAGVSQGALFGHFPNKHLLLSNALEHLLGQLVSEFGQALADVPVGDDRIAEIVGAVWKLFIQPRMRVVFELYIAAHTDPALGEVLNPVLTSHSANLIASARILFPEAARDHDDFDGSIIGVLTAFQGAALIGLVSFDADAERSQLAFLVRLVKRELAGD